MILLQQAIISIGYDNHPAIDTFLNKIDKILVKNNKIYIKDIGQITDLDSCFFAESKASIFPLLDSRYKPVKKILEAAAKAYIDGDYDKCAVSSGRAFESTLKCIFDDRGYTYNPEKDTTGTLIDLLFSNKFLKPEDYMNASSLNAIVISFACGLPKLRNPSSHGPTSKGYDTQKYTAKLALDLDFSYIGFLVSKNNEYE